MQATLLINQNQIKINKFDLKTNQVKTKKKIQLNCTSEYHSPKFSAFLLVKPNLVSFLTSFFFPPPTKKFWPLNWNVECKERVGRLGMWNNLIVVVLVVLVVFGVLQRIVVVFCCHRSPPLWRMTSTWSWNRMLPMRNWRRRRNVYEWIQKRCYLVELERRRERMERARAMVPAVRGDSLSVFCNL